MIAKNRILKLTLFVTVLSILIMHVLKIVFFGFSLNQLTIALYLVLGYAIFKENKMAYFYFFFLMGFLSSVTLEHPDNLTPGAILFIGLLYSGSYTSLFLSFGNIFIGYIVNGFLHQHEDFYNIPVGIVGNIGFLIFVFICVIKQVADIEYLSKVFPLTPRQLIILQCLHKGVSRRRMPEKVKQWKLNYFGIDKFTFHIINAEISEIKTALGLNSEFELGAWYESHVKNNRFTSNI